MRGGGCVAAGRDNEGGAAGDAGGVTARGLGPVDLELASGAYGCLLGPAGAGKTVWLRAVAGLAASSGEVLVDGAALAGMPVRRRGFAMLATTPARQRARRVPFASVGGWLSFAQRSRAGRRPSGLEPLLSEFELDGAADPGRLDERGWFRARLAAALAGEPRLLLIDDPLAGWGDITAGGRAVAECGAAARPDGAACDPAAGRGVRAG